jgi:hypothetical protein
MDRNEKIKLAETWFGFCTQAKRISPKATMTKIQESMNKWHPDNISFTEEEILLGAEKAGYRYSKKAPYKFNIMTSTSQQFMEREKLTKFENYAPYYFYFLPNKEKLLIVHEFIMFTLNKDSYKQTNERYKKEDNPDWNEEEHNKYWAGNGSRYYSKNPEDHDYYIKENNNTNYGRDYIYKKIDVETGETYQTVSLRYTYELRIISNDPDKENKLTIERKEHNSNTYDITLRSRSMDRLLKVDTVMTTDFTASSPVYVRFLEKLIELEPDLDLNCEERILMDI